MSETTPQGQIVRVRLDQLHESPFNPRLTFNERSLQELANSIRESGLVVHPLVRPLPQGDIEMQYYELVHGHRRTRAAALADLWEIDVVVRELDDATAAKMQIAENLQREDVHPIEEAEGFRALMRHHGVTADQLAEQTGKSRSYIYGRLKLNGLCAEVRKACLAGEVGGEVALLIARLRTEKLQAKALGYIKGKYIDLGDGGAKSYRAIKDLLAERFTLELKGAIFSIEAADLLPDAGSCVECPKRTANAPEFEDLAQGSREDRHYYSRRPIGPDVCTDPDCFAAKKTAHLKLQAAELEAKGKTVITGNKARAAIGADGKLKDGYVPLAEVRDALKKTKGKEVATVSVQDPRSGKVVLAVKRDDLVAAGIKRKEAKAPSGTNGDWALKQRRRDEQARTETLVREEVLRRVRGQVGQAARSFADLQLLATYQLEMLDYDDEQLLAELWECNRVDDLRNRLGSMSADDLTRLMLDIALSFKVRVAGYELDQQASYLWKAAEHYGVDVDQVREEVTNPASTPSTAAQAPEGAAEGSADAAPIAKAARKKASAPKGAKTDDTAQAAPLASDADDKTLPLFKGGNKAHSKKTKGTSPTPAVKLSPVAAWPFPPMAKESEAAA